MMSAIGPTLHPHFINSTDVRKQLQCCQFSKNYDRKPTLFPNLLHRLETSIKLHTIAVDLLLSKSLSDNIKKSITDDVIVLIIPEACNDVMNILDSL